MISYLIIPEEFALEHNNTLPDPIKRPSEGFNSAKLKDGRWACGTDMLDKFPAIFATLEYPIEELSVDDFEAVEEDF